MGSSVPLLFAKKETNVWKLDDSVEEDLIDEDELLDESDLVKPDASSLRGEIKRLEIENCNTVQRIRGFTLNKFFFSL